MHQLEKHTLENIRKSDVKAFESLFRSYFAQLSNYAGEILKDADMGEEIAEEVFVKFWEQREHIKIDVSIRAYLFKSTYNHCINYLKHQKVKEKYRLFFLHHIHPEQYNADYSNDYPLSSILSKEIEHLVEKAIEKLPMQCREIFILSRYEELKNDKIAEKLGVSVSTVKTQLSRAMVKLQKELHEVLPLL